MKTFSNLIAALLLTLAAMPANAQFNIKKAIGGATKAAQAATLTDDQMAEYVKASVEWMDKNNPVLPADNPYTQRLARLTEGIKDADGIPLNFKVYNVVDVNAFACPDGSVRVFSSLMDIMNDDELMGIIGHEIGHVIKRHSKNAFKTSLLTDALKDGVASTGNIAAQLSESKLGALTSSLINAKFSQKQENEADNCGYDFLVANKRNPWGMVMAFEKLMGSDSTATKKSSYIQKAFSSHPDTKKRIENMTKRCEKDGYKRPEEK